MGVYFPNCPFWKTTVTSACKWSDSVDKHLQQLHFSVLWIAPKIGCFQHHQRWILWKHSVFAGFTVPQFDVVALIGSSSWFSCTPKKVFFESPYLFLTRWFYLLVLIHCIVYIQNPIPSPWYYFTSLFLLSLWLLFFSENQVSFYQVFFSLLIFGASTKLFLFSPWNQLYYSL